MDNEPQKPVTSPKPTWAQMAVNFGSTIKAVTEHAARTGTVLSSEEKRSQRYSLCLECQFFEGTMHRCRQCGCFMNSKVLFEAAKCPVGKW